MTDEGERSEGLRERKRRHTLERIAAAGLELFLRDGYDATTLEAIATAAGISRRTFFAYFKSKEEVLLAGHGSGFSQALHGTFLEESSEQSPLAAARACFLKLASRYETKDSISVDRLVRSIEPLRIRKEATFIAMEADLFAAMRTVWPDAGQQEQLRLAAAVSLCALRLALECWRNEDAKRPIAAYIDENFSMLDSLVRPRMGAEAS
jgi:AcrR family transcriptional regulator